MNIYIFILHLVLSSRCANCRLHGPEECWYRMTKENAHRPSNYMSSPPKNALCSYSHHSKRIKESTIQYSTSTLTRQPTKTTGGASSTFCPYCTVYTCVVHRPSTQCLLSFFVTNEQDRGMGGVHLKQALPALGFFLPVEFVRKGGCFGGCCSPGRSDVGGYFLLPCGRLKIMYHGKEKKKVPCPLDSLLALTGAPSQDAAGYC